MNIVGHKSDQGQTFPFAQLKIFLTDCHIPQSFVFPDSVTVFHVKNSGPFSSFISDIANSNTLQSFQADGSRRGKSDFDDFDFSQLSESTSLQTISIHNSSKLSHLSLDITFPMLKDLRILDLSYNNSLQHIDTNTLPLLTNLLVLNLSYCNIFRLPSNIGKMTKLMDLDISHNVISNLPPSIKQCHQLTKLNLCKNQLDHLPNLTELRRLSFIDISDNQLSIFPKFITQLRYLTTLNIKDNDFDSVPSLSTLKYLRTLIIGNFLPTKGLTQFPLNLHLLPLETFEFSRVHWPPSMNTSTRIKSLRKLVFSWINFASKRHLPFLHPLHSLNILTFTHCSFEKLTPFGFSSKWKLPPMLTQLNLSHNGISYLPSQFFENAKLIQFVNLSHNNLSHLPKSITNLKYLTHLDLIDNTYSLMDDWEEMLQRYIFNPNLNVVWSDSINNIPNSEDPQTRTKISKPNSSDEEFSDDSDDEWTEDDESQLRELEKELKRDSWIPGFLLRKGIDSTIIFFFIGMCIFSFFFVTGPNGILNKQVRAFFGQFGIE